METKNLHERLKRYGLSAGAGIAALSGQSQILYTDVDPDLTVSGPMTSHGLDIDNDGTTDFLFTNLFIQSTYSYYGFPFTFEVKGVVVQAQNPQHRIIGSSSYNAPYALAGGVYIGPSGQFVSATSYSPLIAKFSYNYGSGSYQNEMGNWAIGETRFLGVRVRIGSQNHFGWARLTVNGYNSFTLHDYAINMEAGKGIRAGDTVTAVATIEFTDAPIAVDVADNGNGADIRVTFDAATHEEGIFEYRVMVVKASEAATFNMSAAEALNDTRYRIVDPKGKAEYTTLLSAGLHDSDGDLITYDEPYKVFVLAFTKLGSGFNGALSPESNEVTLNKPKDPPIGIAQAENTIGLRAFANEREIVVETRETADVEVRDAMGRLMQSLSLNAGTTHTAHTLSSGIYFLTAHSASGSQSLKFIVP